MTWISFCLVPGVVPFSLTFKRAVLFTTYLIFMHNWRGRHDTLPYGIDQEIMPALSPHANISDYQLQLRRCQKRLGLNFSHYFRYTHQLQMLHEERLSPFALQPLRLASNILKP